jgi:SAM-dependent methyltransferase
MQTATIPQASPPAHTAQIDAEAPFAYSGVAALETMAEAVNYNAFLLGLITARVNSNDWILDFGAGTGTLARPLAAAGYRVTCVEPDDDLRSGLSAAGLTADASLSFSSNEQFDAIYTFNVLEHIADDASTVAALSARLKRGGRLLVYVPAFQILYSSMDRKVGHFRRYRKAQLRQAIQSAGLKVDSIGYVDSLGFFAALLFRLIDNDRGTINRRGLIAYDRCVFPLSRRLDRLTGRWFGKNMFAVASVP